MKVVDDIELVKPARKDGGDRYESKDGRLVIYVPQYISRSDGPLPNKITVTFES